MICIISIHIHFSDEDACILQLLLVTPTQTEELKISASLQHNTVHVNSIYITLYLLSCNFWMDFMYVYIIETIFLQMDYPCRAFLSGLCKNV